MSDTLAQLAVRVYTVLLPFAWLVLAIAIFVLVPMALYRNTRPQAGVGLFMASYLFGLTTWTLGAAVTFAMFGWPGLLIGMFFFGVGVVPIGIFAAFFAVGSTSLGLSLIVMTAIAWGSRVAGAILADSSG